MVEGWKAEAAVLEDFVAGVGLDSGAHCEGAVVHDGQRHWGVAEGVLDQDKREEEGGEQRKQP